MPQMADLFGTPDIWVEAKRTERMNIIAALEQAERGTVASQSPDMPVVITRKNRIQTSQSVAAMRLETFTRIYQGYLKYHGHI